MEHWSNWKSSVEISCPMVGSSVLVLPNCSGHDVCTGCCNQFLVEGVGSTCHVIRVRDGVLRLMARDRAIFSKEKCVIPWGSRLVELRGIELIIFEQMPACEAGWV